MAITIDTSRALRRPLELVMLVEAIVKAGPADETFWIEWKSELDLTKPLGAFKAARAILSFANRMPNTAATICEGLSYLIVGAEAGSSAGTPALDAADLEQALIKYLGSDGPVWSPTHVTVQGKNVLVIVIEPPGWGDPPHTLRQTYNNNIEGTIYVRSQAISRPANAEEVRLLGQRLLRGQQTPELDGLRVGFTLSRPEAVIALDPTPEQVDEWIEARREALVAHQRAVVAAMEEPRGASVGALLRPSVDEQAIDEHIALCRERLFGATLRELLEGDFGQLTMNVINPHPRTLEAVELTLKIEAPHSAFEKDDVPDELQDLPVAPKPKRPFNWAERLSPPYVGWAARSVLSQSSLRAGDPWIDVEPDAITLQIGQVRPEKVVPSTTFHLFLLQRPPDNQLTVQWTLTSPSADGVQRGTTSLPVLPTQRVFLPPDHGLPDETG